MRSLNNTSRQDLRLHIRIVANTSLFLALIQKNIDVKEISFAAKSRVTYSSDLLTLNPVERLDTVRTAYDLNSKTQIRDLQQLLRVNTSNKGDTHPSVKSAYDPAKPRTCCF